MVSIFGYEQSCYFFKIQELLWWDCIVICIGIKKGVHPIVKKKKKERHNLTK